MRLLASNPLFASSLSDFLPEFSLPYSTPLTDTSTGHSRLETPVPVMREDRPALLVSSTSWTPDEDFGMLLKALEGYERKARERESSRKKKSLPKVFVIVTGKGPLRDKYMHEVERLQKDGVDGVGWRNVRCVSMWLEAEDYPLLLGLSNCDYRSMRARY